MDSLAPRYGEDFWFLALSRHGAVRGRAACRGAPKIERSVTANPNNAHGAHAFAHVCYESGDRDTARGYLSSWLSTYPRDGFFHGHVSWHLSLCELQAGNGKRDAPVSGRHRADRHSGGPQQRMSDGAAFLWRSDSRPSARCRCVARDADYAGEALPRPGSGLADLHVILARAVTRDDAALDMFSGQIEEMAHSGRYPSGDYLPALAVVSRRSKGGTSRGRSRHWSRCSGKTNASAGAARSMT